MIYLDHAAATPVSKKALQAMQPYFSEHFFNPSSPYLPAKEVMEDYEYAKARIAHCIGAKGNDLVITSGATESINLAFKPFSHILYLATEHDSVRKTARLAQKSAEIGVLKDGRIDLDDFCRKITSETELVSVSLANNEIGTIQPLAEIAEIIRGERQKRLAAGNETPLYLHSDASQALNLLDINVARLGVDMLTLNAAKVGGPKGVGALYIGHGVRLQPITTGGGQERGLRSGTENVPGVMGFATAAEETKSHLVSNRQKYQEFAQIFAKTFPDNILPVKHKMGNFLTLIFPGLDAERLIYKLEEKEVYVSTGAACAASKNQKSHVLSAIGLTDEEIAGSLRVTFGVTNDKDQIVSAAKIIAEAVAAERSRA